MKKKKKKLWQKCGKWIETEKSLEAGLYQQFRQGTTGNKFHGQVGKGLRSADGKSKSESGSKKKEKKRRKSKKERKWWQIERLYNG